MKGTLARFGVAMDDELLRELDALVEIRGATRSKVLSDLVRAELMRSKLAPDSPAVVVLTLVYDHHVRELTEKLTRMQHDLGEKVRATLHVHLSHDECLEVVVMRGQAQELQLSAERLTGARGVVHAGMELVAGVGGDGHQDHGPSVGQTARRPAARPARAALPARAPAPAPRDRRRGGGYGR